MFVLSFEYFALWYLQWKSKSISQHKHTLFFCYPVSLYNHAYVQQTPVSSFLSIFANDTHQQFTSHTCSLQCYSTSTSIGILYFRSTVSLSSPSILIVYMISVLIVPTFHCQVIQYCWALPSTFSSFYFYLLLSHISCFYAPDHLSSIMCCV